MKCVKFFSILMALGVLGYSSFYITYESVSAIVMREAEENKKNEIIIKPIIIEEYEDKKSELEVEKKEVLNVKTDNFIFIGDSRLDSMNSLSHNIGFNSVEFITTKNPDYYWIVNEGIDGLDCALKNNPGSYNIVFNLGINDFNNIKMYIDFFNTLSERYPEQNIFLLGIGPLDEVKAIENNITHVNNDDIYNFNIDIMKSLDENVHMIYVFQEFIVSGYDTIDGYYLTDDTSMSLLKFIWNHVKSLQNN